MFTLLRKNRFCAENSNTCSERKKAQSPRFYVVLESLQSTGERQAEYSLLAPSLCLFTLLRRIAFVQKTLTLVQNERKHRAPDLLLPWRACRALGQGRQRIPCWHLLCAWEAEVFTLLCRIAFVQKTVTLVQKERKHRAPDLMLSWRACRALGKGRQTIPC